MLPEVLALTLAFLLLTPLVAFESFFTPLVPLVLARTEARLRLGLYSSPVSLLYLLFLDERFFFADFTL